MTFENYPSGRGIISAHHQSGIDPPLLPCPFCGGDDLEVGNTHTPSYTVECVSCGAQGGDCKSGKGRSKAAHRGAFLSAIRAWNTRRAPACTITERESAP